MSGFHLAWASSWISSLCDLLAFCHVLIVFFICIFQVHHKETQAVAHYLHSQQM